MKQSNLHSAGRSTRQSTRSTKDTDISLKYSMKYHPMDEFIRPDSMGTVEARGEKVQPCPTKAPQKSSTQDEVVSIIDLIPEELALEPQLGSPPCRRSTRARRQDEPNYDMSYHPIDDAMNDNPRENGSVRSNPVSRPPGKEDSKLSLTSHFLREWRNLSSLDRRVYLLLKEISTADSAVSPHRSERTQALIREANIPKDVVMACGGIQALVTRFENVRWKVEGVFDAEPELVEHSSWQHRYAEDLMYWRYREGSTVKAARLRDKKRRKGTQINRSNEAEKKRYATDLHAEGKPMFTHGPNADTEEDLKILSADEVDHWRNEISANTEGMMNEAAFAELLPSSSSSTETAVSGERQCDANSLLTYHREPTNPVKADFQVFEDPETQRLNINCYDTVRIYLKSPVGTKSMDLLNVAYVSDFQTNLVAQSILRRKGLYFDDLEMHLHREGATMATVQAYGGHYLLKNNTGLVNQKV